jgi:hypothetical protein
LITQPLATVLASGDYLNERIFHLGEAISEIPAGTEVGQ